MTTARNGRQRQAAPPPPADDFTPVVAAMIVCRKCAALLLDTRAARDQHAGFHAALRRLWDQAGARS